MTSDKKRIVWYLSLEVPALFDMNYDKKYVVSFYINSLKVSESLHNSHKCQNQRPI